MLNSFLKRAILSSTALLCIAACLTDLAMLFVFGNQIPGYNQLTNTISSLGISSSPVSAAVTIWSVILGIIFILFGFGFREVFNKYDKNTRRAFWLIIIYGLGEGVASGLFKADHNNGALTTAAIVHDLLGGIGVLALILLPFVLRKIFTKEYFPLFSRFSLIVWGIGLTSLILFSFRIHYFEHTFLNTYSGIWQRIFLVDYYSYFIVIALMLVQEIKKKSITQ